MKPRRRPIRRSLRRVHRPGKFSTTKELLRKLQQHPMYEAILETHDIAYEFNQLLKRALMVDEIEKVIDSTSDPEFALEQIQELLDG